MLSISSPMKSAETAVQYYQDTRKEDYYLNGIGREGRWLGEGAVWFGLAGTVRRDQFRNLLRGLSQDGERPLVQNADKPDRACCWDFTFNAPKSVSVLWALAPADQRSQIEEAHHRAVQAAVARAEQVGGITRRGTGGKKKERAQLVWAAFQEGTSRAQDPHLHTHAVLLNLGLRADGSTGSIHTPDLFQWKMALGAIYQAELAAQLRQRPGCTIVPDKVAFRIEAVPQEVCRALSKRRAVIESTMVERGVSGAVAANAEGAPDGHGDFVTLSLISDGHPTWTAERTGSAVEGTWIRKPESSYNAPAGEPLKIVKPIAAAPSFFRLVR